MFERTPQRQPASLGSTRGANDPASARRAVIVRAWVPKARSPTLNSSSRVSLSDSNQASSLRRDLDGRGDDLDADRHAAGDPVGERRTASASPVGRPSS